MANFIGLNQLVADDTNCFQKCCSDSRRHQAVMAVQGEKEAVGAEGGQIMRGQPPSTFKLPDPERQANFMVNWATHLDSQITGLWGRTQHPAQTHFTHTTQTTQLPQSAANRPQHTSSKHNACQELFVDTHVQVFNAKTFTNHICTK